MITAVVLTKNEEKNIKECLESIKWCDEIILIDDESKDKTVKIAQNYKAKVFVNPLKNNFATQRNFGLKKAIGDWVFFIDADERVSEALWFEIMQHTNSSISDVSGFYIKRKDIIWGKELKFGETGNTKLLRLARREAGEWVGHVHEEWAIKGKKVTLKKELIHYPHQSVKEFLSEVNYYTDLRADELYRKGIKGSWIIIVLYPVGKFIKTYVAQQGFRDGVPGLITALMMSFHSFLVRSKLWNKYRKSK
jgi:glycosyltransferase involved in cell wall biosynthesis